jgi:Glycosyl hydrolase family 92 catalytic domain
MYIAFTDPAGLPGNDDQCAMGTLLIFHLLGLYPGKCHRHHYWPFRSIAIPVPTTTQYLVLSPFLPAYTIHNTDLNRSTTVTVEGFDPKSLKPTIPAGASAYVKSVIINGTPAESRCHLDFYDTFRVGGNITIVLTSNKTEVDSCGGSLPDSLSTGGWAAAR